MRKTRRKDKGVVLCERDWRIMHLLFESKVLSREQIGKQFFPDVSKHTVNRRLRKIVDLGLIKGKPVVYDRKIFYGYSLTQRGLAKVKPILPYDVTATRSSSECPLHDLLLNNIRVAFEGKDAVRNYYTENVLQTCTELQNDEKFQPFIELNSDAMAEVNSKIGVLNLAIEFDTTRKNKRRYSEKIDDYYVENGVDGVLYICADKYILNALLKVDKEVSERHECDHKLYFALLKDVTVATSELTFTNADKHIFSVS